MSRFAIETHKLISVSVFSASVQFGDVAPLLGLAALFFALALLSFERRNVTVGAWPWQRPQISQ